MSTKEMEYWPLAVVWELTMACNMNCRHCGSSASESKPDELKTEEALRLCDDLVEMHTERVTLSGGEPLLREDWPLLTKRLTDKGIEVNMVSNGWLVNNKTIDKAESANLASIAVSIDGLNTTHDFFRRSDSFQKSLDALKTMQDGDFPASVITTVMKRNLSELSQLKEILVDLGVEFWQLQYGLPMGNFAAHRDEVLAPDDVIPLLEFAQTVYDEGLIHVVLADCLGYYTKTSVEIRKSSPEKNSQWMGCPAGKFSLGVRYNGDICGCNGIRSDQFIEGNIREIPLKDLWTRSGAFAWNRNRTRESNTGFCRICQFGDLCLAGCTGTRLTLSNSNEENTYCAYRISIERLFPKIEVIRDSDTLVARAIEAMDLELFEVAAKCLSHALDLNPEDVNTLKHAGYVAFKLGDYRYCCETNEKILSLQPKNAYAMKGLGLALVKMGDTEAGISTLRSSLPFWTNDFMDPYHDLAVILHEQGRTNEAYDILKQASKLSDSFHHRFHKLYETLQRESM